MDKRRGKKRIWLRALAIPVGALLAVLGILYLAGSGIRSRPDDARAIVESYDPTAFTGLSFSSDGRATPLG